MELFSRLKLFCDDLPDELIELAATDSSVETLCGQLWFVAHSLSLGERRARVLFASPVDPAFLKAWRDYKERYEPAVSTIMLLEFLPELDLNEPPRTPDAERRWINADGEAEEQAKGIEAAIHWARSEVENDFLPDEDFLRKLDEGVAAWDDLVRTHGLDLRGTFRRRALVPFVLVPRQIAARHASADKLSMLKNLQQAHDAFVFGAPYAALALMRSIMETVLRDHYQTEGRDLADRIRNARGKLPAGANPAALHRLRERANAILHLDRDRDHGLPRLDEARLEKEIVSLLVVLRDLIEGAK